jgi:hypothetical protein
MKRTDPIAIYDPHTDLPLALATTWNGAIELAREYARRDDAPRVVAVLGERVGWEIPPEGPSRPVFYSSFYCVWSY